MTEVCSCCKTISGRRSRPRLPILSLEGPGGRQSYFKPKRPYLVLAAPGASDQDVWGATFHGGSIDTIGGRGRLQRPEISPIYPLQLSLSLAAPHLHGVLVLVTGNKFIAGVIVTGDKVIAGVVVNGDKVIAGDVVTGDKLFTGINDTGDH